MMEAPNSILSWLDHVRMLNFWLKFSLKTTLVNEKSYTNTLDLPPPLRPSMLAQTQMKVFRLGFRSRPHNGYLGGRPQRVPQWKAKASPPGHKTTTPTWKSLKQAFYSEVMPLHSLKGHVPAHHRLCIPFYAEILEGKNKTTP